MAIPINLETQKKDRALNKPVIRATPKQKRAFREILGNPSLSGKEALVRAGYSAAVAQNPASVTESQGFLALMDAAGLTDQALNTYLEDDIRAKPKNRLGELTLAYKLKGKLKESETGQQFTPATINIAIISKPINGSVEPPISQ